MSPSSKKWVKEDTLNSSSSWRNCSVHGLTCSLRIFLLESISIEWSMSWSTSSCSETVLDVVWRRLMRRDPLPALLLVGCTRRRCWRFDDVDDAVDDADEQTDGLGDGGGVTCICRSTSVSSNVLLKVASPSLGRHMFNYFQLNSINLIEMNIQQYLKSNRSILTFSKGISGDQSTPLTSSSVLRTDASPLDVAPTETPPIDGRFEWSNVEDTVVVAVTPVVVAVAAAAAAAAAAAVSVAAVTLFFLWPCSSSIHVSIICVRDGCRHGRRFFTVSGSTRLMRNVSTLCSCKFKPSSRRFHNSKCLWCYSPSSMYFWCLRYPVRLRKHRWDNPALPSICGRVWPSKTSINPLGNPF